MIFAIKRCEKGGYRGTNEQSILKTGGSSADFAVNCLERAGTGDSTRNLFTRSCLMSFYRFEGVVRTAWQEQTSLYHACEDKRAFCHSMVTFCDINDKSMKRHQGQQILNESEMWKFCTFGEFLAN